MTPSKKKSAFTLIELLVVITIIAILAGIALPVFSGVQERARATQDANNLRQLGIASIAYFNDNDDTIFVSGSSVSLSLNPKYVSVWKSFQSPFDKRASAETLAQNPPVSYDLNRNLMGKNCSSVASPSNCIMFAPLLDASSTFTNLKFSGIPTSSPALDITSNPGLTGGTHSKGKRINVLMQDAHIESMMMSDFHSTLPNSDGNATITDIRWNK